MEVKRHMITVREKSKEVNVMDVEHVFALTVGGLLLLSGVRRGGALGTILKLAGAGMVFRGQQGYGRLHKALGICTPENLTGVGKYNVMVESQIIVDRPHEELYRIWRNLENLPVFMDHLLSVHEIDDTRSLWVARAPAGMVIKWDAQIINDVENKLIAWETIEGSGVDNAGSVHFEPIGDDRTRVRVRLRYDPPADMLGVWIAKVFRNDPQSQIDKDLVRFKKIMEVGRREAYDAKRPEAALR